MGFCKHFERKLQGSFMLAILCDFDQLELLTIKRSVPLGTSGYPRLLRSWRVAPATSPVLLPTPVRHCSCTHPGTPTPSIKHVMNKIAWCFGLPRRLSGARPSPGLSLIPPSQMMCNGDREAAAWNARTDTLLFGSTLPREKSTSLEPTETRWGTGGEQ